MRNRLRPLPHAWMALLLACCLGLLAACGGGGHSHTPPGAATGSLTVTIGGLPAGVAAAVTVTGPASYSKALTASGTLDGLAPGAYSVSAASIAQGTGSLAPTPVTQQVQVSAGATASAAVAYAASAPLALALQEVASGLSAPIYLTAPAGDSRLFILERAGRIRVVQNGSLLATPFLDIGSLTTTNGERGLLSMAFHPQYASNGYFFIYYTNLAGDIVIERRQVSAGNANVADPLSALTILTIPHPVRPVGQAGNNYGWNIMEGTQCYNSTSCNQAGLVLPAITYNNDTANGCSITGGYVYRGAALPELAGQYLYSDYCSAWLKSFSYSNGTASAVKDWGITNVGNILSFGQDAQNELYMLSGTGKVYKIVRK